MSMRALLLAVKEHLLDSETQGLNYREEFCDVNPDGQPPSAIVPDLYVSIWPSSWGTQQVEGLCENLGISITVSLRAKGIPYDRWGKELILKNKTGLLYHLDRIKSHMHLDHAEDAIITRANKHITTAANGFVEPLRFQDGGRIEVKGGQWWRSKPGDPQQGLAQTLSFSASGRYQTIESMT